MQDKKQKNISGNSKLLNKLFPVCLSEESETKFEKIILFVAIFAFLAHVILILLVEAGIIPQSFYSDSGKKPNVLTAVYTPFSIILIYEVYLLIYYLPKSIIFYIGKQYEVIALILIRKVFNDLANIFSINEPSFEVIPFKELILTFSGLLVLFLLIFFYYKIGGQEQKKRSQYMCDNPKEQSFVTAKKYMALVLLFVFVLLFIEGFFELRYYDSFLINDIIRFIKELNNIFFNTFFTFLVLTEVLLLLFTYNLSNRFYTVMRNSGFIISTILLKLSFKTEGLDNMAIILIAVTFGVLTLGIYRLYAKKLGYSQDI